MKRPVFSSRFIAAAALAVAALGAGSVAQAHTDVQFSIGLPGLPGLPIFIPPPVYVRSEPVYVQPRPVYVQPPPVVEYERPWRPEYRPEFERERDWRHGEWRQREWEHREWERREWGHRHHDGDQSRGGGRD